MPQLARDAAPGPRGPGSVRGSARGVW